MIKAIFFDIDGTLVSHASGGIPESTQNAIRQLRNKEIMLFLATGRHRTEVQRLPTGCLSFDGYVTLNGQICLDGQGRLLCDTPINPLDTAKLVSVFSKNELPVMIIQRDRMYINFINEAVRRAQKAISTPLPEAGSYTGETVYQFIVYDSGAAVNALIRELSGCKMSRWNPYAVDVIPRDGGKVAGIRRCLQHFGILQQEIMAFGDGENDMDMLRYAGIGVAMGNADHAVQNSADYVTADIDQDGIYAALQHFGIL